MLVIIIQENLPILFVDNINVTVWKVCVFEVFLVRKKENTDQKNSKYGQFLLSVYTPLEKNSKESLLHSTECKMRIFSVHIKTNRISQVLTQE